MFKALNVAISENALPADEPSSTGFTIIEKLLSTVLLFAVALALKELVVDEFTSVGSPLISPVAEFKLVPAGSDPDTIEYAIVSPSASVAESVA